MYYLVNYVQGSYQAIGSNYPRISRTVPDFSCCPGYRKAQLQLYCCMVLHKHYYIVTTNEFLVVK